MTSSNDNFKPGSLVIAFPHTGTVHVPWMNSLGAFREYDACNRHVMRAVIDKGGMYVSANRNQLVEQFLAMPALPERKIPEPEWLLSLDTDHIFLPQHPYMLLEDAHPVERPIMCGLYFNMFNKALVPMWWDRKPDGEFCTCRTVTPAVQRIGAAGFGMTLVHRSALVKMRERYDTGKDPWVWFGHDLGSAGGKPGRLGEDLTFFKRADECGIPVYGDGRVVVSHIKHCVYDVDLFMKLGDFLKPGDEPREHVLNGVGA